MRIGLAVGYFDPQVGGSEEVVKRLAVGLRDRGHDVVVATSPHPRRDPSSMVVPVREFALSGNAVQGMTGDVAGYQDYLRASDRDVWLFYAAQIWSTDAALPVLDSLAAASVVVPCGYSGLHQPAYAEYFSSLPQQLAGADALVYMSANYQDWEHDQLAGLGNRMHLIPNAASDEEFAQPAERGGGAEGRLVITVANHLPDKGHDAVIAAFKAVAGPKDQLVIVGNRLARRRDSPCWIACKKAAFTDRRIRLAEGLPRAEVVRLYRTADVFLFGSRVECAPLVLIEAMAAGLPFVTTPAGNARDYADLALVRDEADLASGLQQLLADRDLRVELGALGRARWDSHHRWSTVVGQYEALLQQLVDARRSSTTDAAPPGPA